MIIVVYAVRILYSTGSQSYCKDACKSIHKPVIILRINLTVEWLALTQQE